MKFVCLIIVVCITLLMPSKITGSSLSNNKVLISNNDIITDLYANSSIVFQYILNSILGNNSEKTNNTVLPFCGDGICDGPETAANCPEDCATTSGGTTVAESSASIKLLLEGYTDAATGLMHTSLNNLGLLPKTQPFNVTPWNYAGTETFGTFPTDITDWVLIMLRDNSGNVLNQKAGYVNLSGQVYDIYGNSEISFSNIEGNYLSIHTRNHLAIIINQAISGQILFDLTTSLSLVDGENQMVAVGSNYALHAGEYAGNGIINNLDYNVWELDNSVINLYTAQDGDGNGIVNNLDYNLWINNRSKVGSSKVQDNEANTPINTDLHLAFSEFDSDNYTIYLSGSNVVLETNGTPNHTSPYWSSTNTRTGTPAVATTHPLFIEPTVTSYANMAPGNIDDFNGMYSLTVPVNPQLAASSTATGLGAIGFAVSGAVIYNDEEGPNVPLDNAVASLDFTAAHTGPQSYHYHLEPKAWSNDDENLIGIINDGFFIYGRKCNSTGSYPTDLDASGGHTSTTQHNANGEYHYHIPNELYLNEYYILFAGDYQGTPNNIQ